MISITLFILVFVAILTFLIFIHEMGHFIAAKLAGIKVLEFGLGFPPRLLAGGVLSRRKSPASKYGK